MKLTKAEIQPLSPPALDAAAEEHRNQLVLAAMAVKAITDAETNLQARNAFC